jgi:hypothetical protein
MNLTANILMRCSECNWEESFEPHHVKPDGTAQVRCDRCKKITLWHRAQGVEMLKPITK